MREIRCDQHSARSARRAPHETEGVQLRNAFRHRRYRHDLRRRGPARVAAASQGGRGLRVAARRRRLCAGEARVSQWPSEPSHRLVHRGIRVVVRLPVARHDAHRHSDSIGRHVESPQVIGAGSDRNVGSPQCHRGRRPRPADRRIRLPHSGYRLPDAGGGEQRSDQLDPSAVPLVQGIPADLAGAHSQARGAAAHDRPAQLHPVQPGARRDPDHRGAEPGVLVDHRAVVSRAARRDRCRIPLVHLLSRAGRAGPRQLRHPLHERHRAARGRPARSAGARPHRSVVLGDDERCGRERHLSADPQSVLLGEDVPRSGPTPRSRLRTRRDDPHVRPPHEGNGLRPGLLGVRGRRILAAGRQRVHHRRCPVPRLGGAERAVQSRSTLGRNRFHLHTADRDASDACRPAQPAVAGPHRTRLRRFTDVGGVHGGLRRTGSLASAPTADCPAPTSSSSRPCSHSTR